MNVELVTCREDVADLAGRWDELASFDPRDGFFRTFAWYRAWMQHIRPEAEPFIVVVRDAQGTIVGLAPLCRLVYPDLGFRLHAVGWGGREVVSGDYLDVISTPEHRPATVAAVWNALADAGSSWSLLVVGELIDGGDSYRALEELATQRGLTIRRQEERICPFISLPSTFEEYLGSLGSSSRYHIRRRIRDVIEKKGASVQVYSQPQELAEHIGTLIQLHLARWQKDNLPGTLGRPGIEPFLRSICADPPAGSSCRLYVLTHEQKPAAALLAFHFGESALYYQAGWDPDSAVAAHSPNVVLMAHSIRDAIENGLHYYDFLRGDEAYKLHWTKTVRTTSTLLVARGFMAKEYLRAARLKDKAKNLLSIGKPTLTEKEESIEIAKHSDSYASGGASGTRLARITAKQNAQNQ
jgi:CelD/BcsL family acetyltransferase involved in cellulose biosynthesis